MQELRYGSWREVVGLVMNYEYVEFTGAECKIC